MINRIMKTGVAAVALAASALLAPSALAQDGFRGDRAVSNPDLRGGPNATFRNDRDNRFDRRRGDRNNFSNGRDTFRGDRGHRGHNKGYKRKVQLNKFGQTRQEVRYLASKAIEACACQLEIDAYKYGYKAASFRNTPYYEQVGPNRFVVKGTAKLFDGYDYNRQSYDCVVKRGNIKRVSNLYPVAYHGRGNKYRRNGYSGISFSFGNIW